MKKLIKVLIITLIVLLPSSHVFASSIMYYGVFGSEIHLNGENQTGYMSFYADKNNSVCLNDAEFSWPSFVDMVKNENGEWCIIDLDSEYGDCGYITCELDGNTYSIYIIKNVPGINGANGAWNGINYIPEESQIAKEESLYVRGTYFDDTEYRGTLLNVPYITEFLIIPGQEDYKGIRLYRNESDAKAFRCIQRVSGYSFPDFVDMYLDRGGQWNYSSVNAKVGDEGVMTFFEDGVLYSAVVRAIDPLSPELYNSSVLEGYSCEELEILNDLVERDLLMEQLCEHADEKQIEAINQAEDTIITLDMYTKEVSLDNEDTETEDDEILSSLELINEGLSEDEEVLYSVDINVNARVQDAESLLTLARDIPVTELDAPVQVVLYSEEIKTSDDDIKVVSVHDGEMLDVPVVEINRDEGSVTIEADKFSVYAIVKCKNIHEEEPTVSEPEDVKTANHNMIALGEVCVLVLLVIFLLFKKIKRNR